MSLASATLIGPSAGMKPDSSGWPGPQRHPILEAALEYASLGLRVIPLHDRSKLPRIKRWQKAASTVQPVIEGWFKKWPDANLGIATGMGIIALDVDLGSGGTESLARLLTEHGPLPETAEALTGSGGSHYLFRVDPALVIKNSAKSLGAGLDIRADGGQIVASPSVHPTTGERYVWIRHPSVVIAPAPVWLLDMVSPPSGRFQRSLAVGACSGKRGLKPTGGRKGTRIAPEPSPRLIPDDGSAKAGDSSARALKRRAQKPTGELDADALADDVIERFSVKAIGQRHGLMTCAVGSLAGRGHADGAIIMALMLWHEHYLGLGTIGSDREVMERELIACLSATRSNPNFRRSASQADYLAESVAYELTDRMRTLLVGTLDELKAGCDLTPKWGEDGGDGMALDHDQTALNPGPQHLARTPYCNGVTRIGQNGERLCKSMDERRFIETLLAILGSERLVGAESTVKFMHDQLRRVAAGRFGVAFRGWDHKQIDRLKAKFVSRLGKHGRLVPAKRVELLREISKGKRGSGKTVGTPSEYKPRGVEAFFGSDIEAGGDDGSCLACRASQS
jgi:hypothetical protein